MLTYLLYNATIMELYIQIFSIIILIFSVVIHEVAHGYTALLFGDSTAKNMGRLTLNPIKHADLIGSVIVPLILVLLPGSLILGWAKPVPYNPYNFKNRRLGEFWVAFAGPLSNIIIGTLFIGLIKLAPVIGLSPIFVLLSFTIVIINFVLAFFNLIPIPPLDGSKILLTLLPFHLYDKVSDFMQRWGLVLVLFFVFFLWDPFFDTLLKFLFFVTGMTL
jgi:Zn-dependent protease